MNKAKISIPIIALIIFTIISFLSSSSVFADYNCDICKDENGASVEHKCDGITQTVTEFANESCNLNFFRDDEGTDLSLTQILRFDTTGNDTFKKMWYGEGNSLSVKKIFDALIPIASILAVIFFLLEIGDRVFMEQFNAEQLALMFVRLGLSLLVISNGFEILTAVSQLCTGVFDIIQNASNIISDNYGTCLFETVNEMDIFQKAGYMLSLLFSYLFMLIAWVVILATAWKRVFEIIVYAMFFPIGISDVVRGGLESSGVSYIKKMGAKFLQGSIALAIIIAYNLVSALALSSGATGGSLGAVILALTVMTLMLQTDAIASAIVGA